MAISPWMLAAGTTSSNLGRKNSVFSVQSPAVELIFSSEEIAHNVFDFYASVIAAPAGQGTVP
jgi:hypothetical protein